jgi:hypothetical protein
MTTSSTGTSGSGTAGATPPASPTAGTPTPTWKVVTVKMVNWFAFGVVFSVMPIIAGYFISATRGSSRTLTDLIGHGELLIVATGLSAAAAGQAFTMKHNRFGVIPRLLGCGNILIAVFTTLWFADISAALSDKQKIDESFVATYSLWFFAATLITSFSGALVAELEQ